MSVYRVGEMQAKDEATEKLREFLISIMSGIKSSEGCEGVRLYQSQEDTNKFMMIETWDSVRITSGLGEKYFAETVGRSAALVGNFTQRQLLQFNRRKIILGEKSYQRRNGLDNK